MTPWDMWLWGISLYSESFLLISGLLSFLWGLKKKKMLSHMCIFHHQRALVPQAAAAISNQACGMGKQGKK